MVGRVTLPKLSRKVGLRSHSRTESVDARVLALELAKLPSVDEALDAYELQRLPATARVVRLNREAGPERSMEIVTQRAPDGFTEISSVISTDELEAIAATYKTVAGFDPEALNNRPSFSAHRA